MLNRSRREPSTPSFEEIRKRAQLLVLDDKDFPAQRLFKRDGYHVLRWSHVENISQLTDNHFDLILLDMQGVGLRESPKRQGLGILEHVKKLNPTQLVVAYSAEPWSISNRDFFALADATLDKGQDYLDFKGTVDQLLARRYTPGYFINKMNQALGDNAADVPLAVKFALDAMKRSSTAKLRKYLSGVLQNSEKIDAVVTIIAAGIKVFDAVSS